MITAQIVIFKSPVHLLLLSDKPTFSIEKVGYELVSCSAITYKEDKFPEYNTNNLPTYDYDTYIINVFHKIIVHPHWIEFSCGDRANPQLIPISNVSSLILDGNGTDYLEKLKETSH